MKGCRGDASQRTISADSSAAGPEQTRRHKALARRGAKLTAGRRAGEALRKRLLAEGQKTCTETTKLEQKLQKKVLSKTTCLVLEINTKLYF
jgi:hypothetical protein